MRGAADCWGGTWGSLVAAAERGAKPGRRVWIDLFAVRQWPGNVADLDFAGVIRRVKAVLLVAQSLPAVAKLNPQACVQRQVTVPESVWQMVAFMRVWCLVELMAARDNHKPVVVCCGSAERDASTGGHKFVDDLQALGRLEWLVDVTTAEAADPRDKTRILGQVAEAEGGASALSADVSGWISGAVAAASEDSREVYYGRTGVSAAIQAAMCGELEQLEALPAGQLGAAVRVAAALGAEAALVALLRRGAPVDEPSSSSFTALMFAARAGWADMVPILVRAGTKINQPIERAGFVGITALHFAASSGRTEVVTALLTAGAAVNQAKDDGSSPLFMAAQHGHAGVVTVLLEAGASVDQAREIDGSTPLYISAQDGHVDVVAALLVATAAVNQAKEDGWTPLIVSAQNGHAEVVAALLAAAAAVDLAMGAGLTPMYIAAAQGFVKVVAMLLEAGAVVDQVADNGCTSLYISAQEGHAEVVAALLAAGANVDHETNDDDADFGPKSDPLVRTGPTALFAAARGGHTAVAQLLLAAGANTSKTTPWGTPAELATKQGHIGLAQLLS